MNSLLSASWGVSPIIGYHYRVIHRVWVVGKYAPQTLCDIWRETPQNRVESRVIAPEIAEYANQTPVLSRHIPAS